MDEEFGLNRRFVIAAGGAALIAGTAHAQQKQPIATTRYGRAGGFTDKGISVFKGIPYGGDTSLRRFQPALPPTPWRGVLETVKFGPRAPQPAGGPSQFYPVRQEEPVSEDMLKLNVWTPAIGSGKRPVLVYIHGGGFTNYSANSDLYDGVNLARKGDVVVVTMNHRINLFGFLYLGAMGGEQYADSGNVGMLDLVLMLQWVRDNIGQFGGDPGNVTIFGQSGGGAKCSVLMAMPAARGLFHRVLTMSGQQVTVTPSEMASNNARGVLERARLTPETIDGLKSMTMEQLIDASRGSRYWGPVMDGRSVPRHPFEPDASPLSRDIPMIMGNTKDETTLLIGGGDPSLFELTWEQLPAKIEQHIDSYITPLTPAAVVSWYRDRFPGLTPTQTFFKATTALRSWRAQIIQADRRAAQPNAAAIWVYQFDWQSPVAGGKWGATHTGDVPFFFDNIAYGETMNGASAEAQALADKMSDALIAYARTGNPATPSLPEWPRYDLKDRITMVFDNTSKAINDPRGDERRLAGLIPYRQPGT